MNVRALAVFVAIVFRATIMLGQESSLPQPYTSKEAYEIYDLLIPREETYCTKTRVIQQETIQIESGAMDLDSCVSSLVAPEFQDVIADFKAANSKRWLLQRQFELDRQYELVSSETIEATFKMSEQDKAGNDPIGDGWRRFYERYSGSGGYVVLSAVGFNKDKTRAVVYSGAGCGPLCGAWSFHLFKKVNGKWTPTPGIMCYTES